MQASYLWKKLFTKKHLKARYEEKIKNKPSIGLDKVSPKKFEETLDENFEIMAEKALGGSETLGRFKKLTKEDIVNILKISK